MTTTHLLNTLIPKLQQSAAWVITTLRALLEDNDTNYKLVPHFFHGLQQSLPGAHFFKAAAAAAARVPAQLSSVGATQGRRWLQNHKVEARASANTWISVSIKWCWWWWVSKLSEEYRRASLAQASLKVKTWLGCCRQLVWRWKGHAAELQSAGRLVTEVVSLMKALFKLINYLSKQASCTLTANSD